MHRKCTRLLMLSLMGTLIGSTTVISGCGSSMEGTSAQFDAKANLKQQDAMRAYMEKQKPAAGKSAKGNR